MLHSGAIRQIPVDAPAVYAFRITGDVSAADLKAMATTMNDAFDSRTSVSMLLIFDHFEGTEAGVGFDMETLRSQFRALAKVDKYAVVGAPAAAAMLISVMDKVMPTDARAFDASEEMSAWRFVGAAPTV